MKRFLTVPFTTKRPPAKVAGKQGPAVAHLVDPAQRCAPLDPAENNTVQLVRRAELDRQVDILETYTPELDILDGDLLVVDNVEHPIRRVQRWTWRGSEVFLRLIVERL